MKIQNCNNSNQGANPTRKTLLFIGHPTTFYIDQGIKY